MKAKVKGTKERKVSSPIKSSKNIDGLQSIKGVFSGIIFALIAWIVTATLTSKSILQEELSRSNLTELKSSLVMKNFWSTDYKFNPHIRMGYLSLYGIYKMEELLYPAGLAKDTENFEFNELIVNKKRESMQEEKIQESIDNTINQQVGEAIIESRLSSESTQGIEKVVSPEESSETIQNEEKIEKKKRSIPSDFTVSDTKEEEIDSSINEKDDDQDEEVKMSGALKRKLKRKEKKEKRTPILKPDMEQIKVNSEEFRTLREKLGSKHGIDFDSYMMPEGGKDHSYEFNKTEGRVTPYSSSMSINKYLTQNKLLKQEDSPLLNSLMMNRKSLEQTSGGWLGDPFFAEITQSNQIGCDLPIFSPADFDMSTSPPRLLNTGRFGHIDLMEFNDIFDTAFILRNATSDWLANFNWQKHEFVKKYGNRNTRYGSEASIVFSGGNAEVPSTVRQLIELIDNEGQPDTSKSLEENIQEHKEKVSHKGDTFLFDTTILQTIPELMHDFKVPEFFKDWDTKENEKNNDMWHMLSLGPSRNGLPSHNHGKTWISVIYGRKRWFFYPPGYGPPRSIDKYLHPAQPVVQWLAKIYPKMISGNYPKPPLFPQKKVLDNNSYEPQMLNHQTGEFESVRHPLRDEINMHKRQKSMKKDGYRPIECIQEAGDIMYLPSMWTHTTLNIGDTIAIGGQQSLVDHERFTIAKNVYQINPDNFEALKDIGLSYFNSASNQQEILKESIHTIIRLKKDELSKDSQESPIKNLFHKTEKDSGGLVIDTSSNIPVDLTKIISFRPGGGFDIDTTFSKNPIDPGQRSYPLIYQDRYRHQTYEIIDVSGVKFAEQANVFMMDSLSEFTNLYVDSMDSFFVFEYSNSTFYLDYQMYRENLKTNPGEAQERLQKLYKNPIIEIIMKASMEVLDVIETNIVIIPCPDLPDDLASSPINPNAQVQNFYEFYHHKFLSAKENVWKIRNPNKKFKTKKYPTLNLHPILKDLVSLNLKFYRGFKVNQLQECNMEEFINRVGPRKQLYNERLPCGPHRPLYEPLAIPLNNVFKVLKREKVKIEFSKFLVLVKYMQLMNLELDLDDEQSANSEDFEGTLTHVRSLYQSLGSYCRLERFTDCSFEIGKIKLDIQDFERKIDTYGVRIFGELINNKKIFEGDITAYYKFDDNLELDMKNDMVFSMLYMTASNNATLSSVSTTSNRVKIGYLEALQYFKKALHVKPLHPETITMTCDLLGYVDAVDEMRKLVKATERNYDQLDRESFSDISLASLYHKLASCFTTRGLYEDSLKLFQKSIKTLETFLPSHRDLVNNYIQLEHYDDARQALDVYKNVARIVNPNENFNEFNMLSTQSKSKY